jgi:uncharacterized membrane protein
MMLIGFGRDENSKSKWEVHQLKLFEALSLRKALQAQLTQLISLRNNTFEYPEDEQPEFKFDELTNRIKEKANEITALKLAIMKANVNAKLANGLTLSEGIIELANARAASFKI